MDFFNFNQLIVNQLNKMCKLSNLFITDIDTEKLWDLYLNSFPAGTNEIYLTRRAFDCSCCHNFVRRYGNIVAIDDSNNLISMWDINPDYPYNEVVPKLANYVKSAPIKSLFLSEEKVMGVEKTIQTTNVGNITWNHFYYKPDLKFVETKYAASKIGSFTDSKNVFERALNEITDDAINTVEDLINQGSLYKGDEYLHLITQFKKLKSDYNYFNKNVNWIWKNILVTISDSLSRIKNTSIGTLLINISEGMDLDTAVSKYEAIVAPTNYKRPKAIFTSKMIEEAQNKCVELNIDLNRRYAVKDDITVNNVIFIDRSNNFVIENDPFTSLQQDVVPKNLSKIEEVNIEDFIKNVVPTATKIEALVENKHNNNFMSLVAPLNLNATKMFKWNNNFSWSYKGNVTDSIKERVKEAGGSVEGCLRISLSWNNYDDLDLHVFTPNGEHIYFSNPYTIKEKGNLDVDMNAGGRNSRTPVENIIFPSIDLMQKGIYEIKVNNFNARERKDLGFVVQIEFNNTIYELEYDNNNVRNLNVADIVFDGINFTLNSKIKSSQTSKNINNIDTNKFKTVSMLLNSPNYWDDQKIGNKHYFFILENCILDETPRGFFNEYLRDDLITHKRIFEALGSKMIVPPLKNPSDQLSGIGFSSTIRNELIVRVTSTFTRLLKIKF